jgi:hypothetical protein
MPAQYHLSYSPHLIGLPATNDLSPACDRVSPSENLFITTLPAHVASELAFNYVEFCPHKLQILE